MKATSEWISVEKEMPPKNEYVLMNTPFCKYPADVGYYNGYDWFSCEKNIITHNIEFWAKIFKQTTDEN